MVYHKVDPLISRNILLIDGQHEVPAKFKRNVYPNNGEQETYEIGRVRVNKWVVIPPNTAKLIEGKVDKGFSGTGECMIAPLCAKRGVLLPFAAVTLDDNPGTSCIIPVQVTNLSNNFVTFQEDFPLGTIEEVHEVLAEDDDVEREELPPPSDANSSAPQVQPEMVYNVRNCSPSAVADGAGSESVPSPEDVQEDVSYPSFPANMKDAQEWLLDVQSRMPEHMKEMFLCSCVHLNDEESAEFGEVLIQYQGLFAKNDNDLGCFTEMEHSIDTGDTPPIKQRMRRTPLRFRDEEEAYLKKMLTAK